MTKLLGTDRQALGLDLTTASDTFDAFPAAQDLDDDLENLLPSVTRRIYVGGTGDLKVLCRDGSQKTIENVVAGTLFELAIVKIIATGTEATLITVFY